MRRTTLAVLFAAGLWLAASSSARAQIVSLNLGTPTYGTYTVPGGFGVPYYGGAVSPYGYGTTYYSSGYSMYAPGRTYITTTNVPYMGYGYGVAPYSYRNFATPGYGYGYGAGSLFRPYVGRGFGGFRGMPRLR